MMRLPAALALASLTLGSPVYANEKPTTPPRPEAVSVDREAWARQAVERITQFRRLGELELGRAGAGLVKLTFTIGATGEVSEVVVTQSSGKEILDKAAVRMVRAASPLPVPPEGVTTLTLPVRFGP